MSTLHLLLIDPHDKFRESARKYLMRCREFRSVEAVASYNEGMFNYADHFPDLVLVDSDYLSQNFSLLNELEKLKDARQSLDVLALSLFSDDYHNRHQVLSFLVSGIIFKENFSVNLFEYLSSKQDGLTGEQAGSREGVDWCSKNRHPEEPV